MNGNDVLISTLQGITFFLHFSLTPASWTVGVVLSPLSNAGDSFGMAEHGDSRRVDLWAFYAHSRCEGKMSPSYLGCHCLGSLF